MIKKYKIEEVKIRYSDLMDFSLGIMSIMGVMTKNYFMSLIILICWIIISNKKIENKINYKEIEIK